MCTRVSRAKQQHVLTQLLGCALPEPINTEIVSSVASDAWLWHPTTLPTTFESVTIAVSRWNAHSSQQNLNTVPTAAGAAAS